MPKLKFKDLSGQTINGRVVVRHAGWTKRRQSLWLVRDKLGKERVVRSDKLQLGPRLGQSDNPTMRTWRNMTNRCISPKNTSYRYYGGRGIKVCTRWLNSFDAFLADMGQKPNPNFSIDRINNDGDYEPGNCRWATASMQALNRRRAA